MKCKACGLRFYPSGTAPREVYDASYFTGYQGGDYFESVPQRRHEARVRLSLLPEPREGADRLLEVGSAAGFFLDEAVKAGWKVTGVEPSAETAAFAEESFGVDVRTGFVEDLDLSDVKPSTICAWHTLEHIPDPLGTVVSLGDGLPQGGEMVVEVPNGASLRAGIKGDEWAPLEPNVHVAQWTPKALETLFLRAGFSEVKVNTVPFITYIENPLRRFSRQFLLIARQRRWLREPHPTGHELLRAVAVK